MNEPNTLDEQILLALAKPYLHERFHAIKALFTEHSKQAKRIGKESILKKLTKTYNPKIPLPIKESPMVLTDEAKFYNRFVDDLNKFVEIEYRKIEIELSKRDKGA